VLVPEGRTGYKRARARRPARSSSMRKPHSLVLLLSKAGHTWRVGVVITEDDPVGKIVVHRSGATLRGRIIPFER
jgi:hypothetical protein